MTGRELIIYILENHLEDVSLCTIEEAAVKLNTGVATVKALYNIGELKGFKLESKIYIFV